MNKELQEILALKCRSVLPKVLLAAAECSPLSKTGGLADVAGALPKSLNALGMETRVITPYHRVIKNKYADRVEHLCELEISLGWRRQYVGVEKLEVNGIVVYLLDNEFYFGDKIYRGGLAEGEQYAFFQRAVLESIPLLDFQPEVLHCNDWHTAMLPFLIKTQYVGRPQGALKTVLTIHNIAFQGKFGFDFVQDMLGVDSCWYRPDSLEHYGCANFLKAGCVFADKVNTVSPSYADEIRSFRFGEGLQDVLISRGSDVSGIINGLDTEAFDPATDPALSVHFDGDAQAFKRDSKKAIMEEVGLDDVPGRPLIAMVTRMTAQKGFELVMQVLDVLMQKDIAFLLLGTGDERYESFMRQAEERYKGRLCAYLSYNEELSHRIYAGADLLLMPSAFEPCGLSQLIAMRYGTLPIVHEVGGLKDTVQPYNCHDDSGNGFSFAGYEAGIMLGTIYYAMDCWRKPEIRRGLIRRAMGGDFSFAPSALAYAKLFVSILDGARRQLRHDPFDETYRAPLGARRCGETLRLFLESDELLDRCELVVNGSSYPMEKVPGGFAVDYTAPQEPGVCWYYFRLFPQLHFGANGVGEEVKAFQLTVYDADFVTPDWAKGAVMYQIFPDRWRKEGSAAAKGAAYHRAMGRCIEMHKNWDEEVKWEGGENYYPNDFYGGTLAGIRESLPELKERGIDVIYLNPIFESDSNHRYNTADYMKIDPMLGSNAAFKKLCKRAEELGMRLILDGVFSHTGDDSVYFNKRGVYPGQGAWQGETSPYYSWFDFRSFPDDYRCWWGFKSLPEVKEDDESWQDFVLSGEESVVKTWLRCGAGGYRLDVADELPDETLELLRRQVKGCDSDALIVGEVWEDATTKVSYGQPRRYALGRALDSVMNYPLRWALIDFALGKYDARWLRDFLLGQKLNYPAPMYHCLMNLLSSHDTARLRTVLGSGLDGSGMSREDQAAFELTPEQLRQGRARQKLCAALQFTLPGMPCVYYGDEEGMTGFRDPFSRRPYRKNEEELRMYYADLARGRQESSALRRGDAAFCSPDADVICLLRFDEEEVYLVAVNRGLRGGSFPLRLVDFKGVEQDKLRALPEPGIVTVGAMDSVIIKLK